MTTRLDKRATTYEVHTTDMNACAFFLNWLYDKDITDEPSPEIFNGPAAICRYINDCLEHYCRGSREHIHELITDMRYHYERSILSDDKIFWFREDRRACFWVWTRLCCSGRRGVYVDEIKSRNPGNHESRYQQIVEHLQKDSHRRESEISFMESVKMDWADILNNASFLDFLSPKDTDSISYIWNYLCDKKYSIEQIYTPLNDEERWLSILNYLDAVTAKENKGGLATRIKAAFDQRKHRLKKQQDSSSRRFYLKKENDSKLKSLLQSNRMTMDEYFNLLVEREYRNLSDNKGG